MSEHPSNDGQRDVTPGTAGVPAAGSAPVQPNQPNQQDWWARPSGALSQDGGARDGVAGSDGAARGPSAAETTLPPGGRYQQPAAPSTSVFPVQRFGQAGQGAAGQGYGGYQGYSTGAGYGGQQVGYGQQPGGTATLTAPPQRRGRRSVAVISTATVLGLGLAFGAGYLGSQAGSSNTATVSPLATDSSLTQSSTSPSTSAQLSAGTSVQSVSSKLLPSVVSIVSVNGQQVDEGSGVIITATGRILTNDHVIAGSSQITVQFNDGTTAAATVVGGDATDDIAVIQAKGVSGMTAAALGSSASLAVGQQVVAIGSPLGLSGTVTDGIVSALNRPVRTSAATQPQSQGGGQNPYGQLDPNGNQDPNGTGGTGSQDPNGTGSQGQSSTTGSDGTVLNAIQTDAAINHGNSGGPLVDMNGQVIGINSAIASSSSGGSSADQSGSIGVGFAIPIDQAKRIANEIIAKGYATHAVLGATVRDDQASQLGLSSGATVASVTAGGAAAKAGLKAKDVVTKVGSIKVDSSDALIAAIRSQAPGGAVQITYQRDSQSHTVSVTLGSAKSS